MVGVVVVDERPARGRAEPLKAPPGAVKASQAGDRRRGLGARQPCRLQRGGGVQRVVGAGHRQRTSDRASQSASPLLRVSARARRRGPSRRPRPLPRRQQREQLGPVPDDDSVAGAGEERRERRAQLDQRAKRRVVVELDVRQHRDLDLQAEHRAIGLVGLDDQPLALAPVRVRHAVADRAADEPARLEARRAHRMDDHRGGRRLAVGAGDRDRAPQRGQLASSSARGRSASPRSRAARRSGFSAGTAEE